MREPAAIRSTGNPLRGVNPPGVPAARSKSAVARTGRMLFAVSVASFALAPVIGLERSVLVVALAAVLVTATFVTAPAVGLVGVALLCTLDVPIRAYVFPLFGLPYNTFNYALLALALLSIRFLANPREPQSRWLIALAIVMAFYIIPSTNRRLGMQVTLEVVAAFILTGLFVRSVRMRDVLPAMALVNGTVAACCVVGYLVFPPARTVNVNALAQVCVGGLASIALAASVHGAIQRWAFVGVIATINIALVFVLSSRGSFVVSALLGLYIVARSPKLRWKVYLMVSLGAFLMWGASTFGDEFIGAVTKWGRLTDTSLSASQASNARLEIAEVGWSRFRANPLGIGTGSFSNYDQNSLQIGQDDVAAHSAWVKVLSENGVVGILLLFAYLLAFCRSPPRGSLAGRGLGLTVAAVLAIAFLFTEFQSKSLWFFAAGATALLNGAVALPLPGVRGAVGRAAQRQFNPSIDRIRGPRPRP